MNPITWNHMGGTNAAGSTESRHVGASLPNGTTWAQMEDIQRVLLVNPIVAKVQL